jgi:DNA-binding transcriptional regulator YiaG
MTRYPASPRSTGARGHFTSAERLQGQTIAKLRRASGATFPQIAAELGISVATARSWSMDVAPPPRGTMTRKILSAHQPGMTAREVAVAASVSNVAYVRDVLRFHHKPVSRSGQAMPRDQVALRRRALQILREHGFNDADVGTLLGVSRQRATQLRGDEPAIGRSRADAAAMPLDESPTNS